MKKIDKLLQIEKANILAEQRYLESKGLIKENSDTYFESLSETLDEVRRKASSMGLELDEEEMWTHFGTGGIPYGSTKSATIPLLNDGNPILDKRGNVANRAIRISIYRMDSGRYELIQYKTW
jgi:hypothetical protein